MTAHYLIISISGFALLLVLVNVSYKILDKFFVKDTEVGEIYDKQSD